MGLIFAPESSLPSAGRSIEACRMYASDKGIVTQGSPWRSCLAIYRTQTQFASLSAFPTTLSLPRLPEAVWIALCQSACFTCRVRVTERSVDLALRNHLAWTQAHSKLLAALFVKQKIQPFPNLTFFIIQPNAFLNPPSHLQPIILNCVNNREEKDKT